MRKNVSTILVVESRAGSGGKIARVLEKCSAKITQCSSAKQASSVLSQMQRAEELPDLIVLQVGAFDSDALIFLHAFKSAKGTAHIPAILLVDSRKEKEKVELCKFPLSFCFVQPLTFAKLIYALPALNMEVTDSLLFTNPIPEAGHENFNPGL